VSILATMGGGIAGDIGELWELAARREAEREEQRV
jgi:hypothetical protein